MKFSFLSTFYGAIALILVGLVPCPVMGQALTKKNVTEADYGLWHTMASEQLSGNGAWVSYGFSYENNLDTTFVVHTKSLKKFVFPNVITGTFNGEKDFAFIKKERLVLFDLNSGTEKLYPNVSSYSFSADGQYLVTLEDASTLVVRKNGATIERIENVSTYEWNADKTKLVYTTAVNGKGSVGFLSFKKSFSNQLFIQPTEQTFEVLKWQFNGNSVAFYGIDKGNKEVYYYDFLNTKLFTLKSSDVTFPTHMKIAPEQNIELKVSRDGKKVFFGVTTIAAKDTTVYSSGIEVWHSKDLSLYRERKLKASVAYPQFLAVWLPKEAIVMQLSSEKYSWVALNGSQDYSVIADKYQYEPQYKVNADMDYYLMNVRTGAKDLFLKEQSGVDSQMDFSPDGRYISYYKESNWWVYDIVKKTHLNLTKDLNVIWDNRAVDPGNELRVWGQTDWSKDGKFILCYDHYDIWAISTDGKHRKRLTNGKEKQLRFQFDKSAISNVHEFNYADSGTYIYDLSKNSVLTAIDMYGGAVGYYQWQPHKAMTSLVFENAMITKYMKSKTGSAFICVKERYDSSPAIVYVDDGSERVIVQSNEQQKKYQWGKSEMIHYTDSKGTPLNGALFYPANYDATKKVPLIVYIYEIVSRDVHKYVNPTNQNMLGFNITNLTASGYAVLLADIAYEKGNTGISATECVTGAANKVIQMGVADAYKIGLFGHSFGGYETNFIITQTDLFATAISGAGVSDIVGNYFNYNNDWGAIDSFRYENQQFRMGVPFFENKEAYYRNSPLQNAKKITAPLLTWSAKLDENVEPEQGELFYAALRRLKKEHVMLVYPYDGHVLFNHKNQEDLTLKVEDWFGHYLKDAPKKKWMKADFETN
ncbi:dipeptidyl aminopeptidase/acylaminoacyl peptidase [Flavobacterium sp. CG_9.1]|uniref:S9 family peptidase n=1 Tax=Flavobacterium sp. CG_9.1 TaxID=2787728 RepID=UPI0018CA0FD6|nr:prolyl oligopeptidase family serine peptidase [Flavobacterium sp. CG_9.1]MBG6062903.1 dipeptidyl aminopeptidase/acylaminoacyl peptidase [Flavobacterium sp. CG_9.1]